MTKVKTLRDQVDGGGEWPLELEPIVRHPDAGVTHARCVCGGIHTLRCFVNLKGVKVADRVSGRLRRERVRTLPDGLDPRVRWPEQSPGWMCGVCASSIRRRAGLTYADMKGKVE